MSKLLDYVAKFDIVDEREILNVDFFVKNKKVGSVELYLFNDVEESGCDSDEWLLKYYRPEDDTELDPPIIAQGNI